MNGARVSLKLPVSLKTAAQRFARRDGVSLNQFISAAVAEKVGAAGAVEFFEKRGRGGRRDRAIALLRAAPDTPPLATGGAARTAMSAVVNGIASARSPNRRIIGSRENDALVRLHAHHAMLACAAVYTQPARPESLTRSAASSAAR